MVVVSVAIEPDGYLDFGEEFVSVLIRRETEPERPRNQVGAEIAHPTIRIGRSPSRRLPFITLTTLQHDLHTLTGLPGRRVEDMGGKGDHWSAGPMHSIRRSLAFVIKRCCWAPMSTSWLRLLPNLSLAISSISRADFPEAKTI